LVLLALVYALLGPSGALWERLVVALLPGRIVAMDRASPDVRVRRRAVAVHGIITLMLAVLCAGIWALTTRSYYWPFWPMLVTAAVWAAHAWVQLLTVRPSLWRRARMTKALALHGGLTAILVVFLVLVWAATTRGYFWPAWPALALAVIAGTHWLVVVARRIEHLESARAGAVAVQDADLRRIERDLHDGAQARLVSLGMSLGLADQRFEHDPEGARRLVREARTGVTDALAELRDLVRGIRPPVLADRGLAAAISAVADRCPIPVDVYVDADPRPPDAIETAAYFVVAECIANAAKHADASHISVRIERSGPRLRVEVVDDGRGGANSNGPGLNGLRRRVEAVDGSFSVSSPAGGPTVILSGLPCAS
jgi:signal transduction histidine kinase